MFDAYAGSSTEPANYLFAIVLDGTPVAVPYMGAVLDTGTAQIQGTFTEGQADNLANVLNYGALPLTFQPDQAQSIRAQLGSSQLHAGLLAGAVGLLLVVVYAFLYYRGLGIVAISSLAIAALLTYLSVVLLSLYESFALSLAGIAGLIVAIGITADSFVVFFERLRDEVRDGKSLRSAVERGWQRARRTILVSDTVSFIAAAVLYKFADLRRPELRVHPRPDHARRRGRGVPVHQADDHAAGQDQVLRRRAPAVRARPGQARRALAVARQQAPGR